MNEDNHKSEDKKSIFVFIIFLVLVIVFCFYKYIYKKDYLYMIELPCDSTSEKCFIRDCSQGDCPPNNLSSYKKYFIKAYDFKKCGVDSCLDECLAGNADCKKIECDESSNDSCSEK